MKINEVLSLRIVIILLVMLLIIVVIKKPQYKVIEIPQQKEQEKISEATNFILSIENDPCIGDEDSTSIMVEFIDYQCENCRDFYKNNFDSLKQSIDEGKLRLCIKDLPLTLHDKAFEASIAANCAGKQNKYWNFHSKLLRNDKWISSDNTKEIFISYAEEEGLNIELFHKCLEDKTELEEINNDLKEAAKLRISSAPTFIINGKELKGNQNWDIFESLITESYAV